jgi:hypothetical protein
MSQSSHFADGMAPPYGTLLDDVDGYLNDLCPKCNSNHFLKMIHPEIFCAHQSEFTKELNRIVRAIQQQNQGLSLGPND